MAQYTPNFNLYEPDSTDDFADFRTEFNNNMDIIDQNLGGGGGSGGHTIIDENGSTMPTETALQFTGNVSISDDNVNGRTVVDILGGGSGDVLDVEVNGVSVVDGNKVAKITSYKEVTQTQYDALPATKLTDGIAYFVKDAPNNIFSFSTNEEIVGTWITGKPVYQKTYNIGNITVPAPGSSIYGSIDADTTKELINAFGTFKWNNNGTVITFFIGSFIFNGANTSDYFKSAIMQVNNAGIRVAFTQRVSSATVPITDIIITLQYIKTTD